MPSSVAQIMALIEAQHVSKVFTIDDQPIDILHDINISIEPGEFVVIRGESGSGKSTLLSIISGLDKPTRGKIFFDDKDITDLSEDDLAPMRNRDMGFVFQSFHLIPSLTALENVMFPAEIQGNKMAEKKALQLLEKVGLSARKNNFPHQLSGGEKQRVALCRALINDPKVIFADEPTGNLDSKNGSTVLDLLLKFRKEKNTTLVLVTHSKEIARKAERTLTMVDGRIV